MNLSSWIGSIGVALLLLAFILSLVGKLSPGSQIYLILNVIGAGLACVSSFMINFWPFVILEGVWGVASLVPFIKKLIG